MLFLPDAKLELGPMDLFGYVFSLLPLNFTDVEGSLEENRGNMVLLSKKNILFWSLAEIFKIQQHLKESTLAKSAALFLYFFDF